MNLLECLAMYRDLLREEGRNAAEEFLNNTVAEEVHSHIRACFDDKGDVIDVFGSPWQKNVVDLDFLAN